jgi:hypothetical protein
MAGKLEGGALQNQTITFNKLKDSLNATINGQSSGLSVTSVEYPYSDNTLSIIWEETAIIHGSGFQETPNIYISGTQVSNVVFINSEAVSINTANLITSISPYIRPFELQFINNYPIHVQNPDGKVIESGTKLSISRSWSPRNYGYFTGSSNTQKFSFASDSNATTVGNLTQTRSLATGHSSQSHGYVAGGGGPPTGTNTIDKFPFASDANATDVGDLTKATFAAGGSSSVTHGIVAAGDTPFPEVSGADPLIQKFSFASGASSTSGFLLGTTTALYDYTYMGSARSPINAYFFGGVQTLPATPTWTAAFPSPTSRISYSSVYNWRYNFVSDSSATLIAPLQFRNDPGGCESETHGYILGGMNSSPALANSTYLSTITKFPFASDFYQTSTVGSLTITKKRPAGVDSMVSGYSAGGTSSPAPSPPSSFNTNVIDKFPFASDADASDVGDLTYSSEGVGHKY